MPWDRPVARLREYISALRAIWDSFQTDEARSFDGEFYRHTLMTPFFNPGPIVHSEIPVHIAGANTGLASLAGEVCDGFHIHPFHSPEYVRKIVKSASAEGTQKEDRDPEDVDLATSVFVITGDSAAEVEEQREKMRAQISFYTSTPTYRTALEVHGWEDAGERLGKLARNKNWDEMPRLITDEMLRTFAVEAVPDEVGPALRRSLRRPHRPRRPLSTFRTWRAGRLLARDAGRSPRNEIASRHGLRTHFMAPSCFF
jgi:probable F420-dependent oxidoreductase